MPLTEPRLVFQLPGGSFEYPEAYTFWETQHQAHWLHTEVSMAKDLHDWEFMSDAERQIVGSTLKGFAQTEVIVNDYWSTKVHGWFPKPEIAMMTSAFADMETVHAKAYAYLNETLGLTDFAAFLDEPTAAAKINHLIETKGNTLREIARSLAVFSGFAEGVQLFSSFAILMNFSRFNKLKGVGQIVAFSVKDESLHSTGGCWLFRTLMQENPEIWDKAMKAEIYEAARAAVALEDDFIDKVFELGPAEGLDHHDLKAYVRARANTKLGDLGLAPNWRRVDAEALERLTWFDYLTTGQENQDFFANRSTTYNKGTIDWSTMYNWRG